MKQVLHIFRKDTRRFWVEILALVTALSLYAVLYPSRWNYSPEAMHSQYLNLLLPQILVPAACWLLIARVIHAESLVGDRQWWLTRPYERTKLLAAKAVFIVAWIYAPFVIAEAVILKEAGLSPLAHFAGWFPLLAIASAYGVLPLTAIAAMTVNFARMTLVLFGVVIVWIGGTSLASIPRGGYESRVPDEHTLLVVLVVIAGALLVLFIQFATRRVGVAGAVAVATAALATGTAMLLTATRESRIDLRYPAASATGTAPVQVAFAGGSVNFAGDSRTIRSERQDKVYIEVPVMFFGVAEGSAVEVDDVKATIDGPSRGMHWTTPWWASNILRVLPGQHLQHVEFMLDREQYERFKSLPVTLHLTLAVTELRAGGDTTAVLSGGDFAVNGFGVCTGRWLYRFPASIPCRSSELGRPPLTRVSTAWTRTDEPGAYVPPGPITAEAWADTNYYERELFLRLLPVWPGGLSLSPHSAYGELSSTRGLELAPGAPMHFTQYTVTGRTQVSLMRPNFQLPSESR
ncbi:MAG TPA: hypothetical protein VG714_00895 [Acidobacteriaceae bacterium]|nr:hypothetical protein [Acidobacteriaceae bacterium]